MTDDHHLASQYRRNTNQTRALSSAILDHDPPIIQTKSQPARDPVDTLRLRGIPTANSGAGNHIRGTRPDTARIEP